MSFAEGSDEFFMSRALELAVRAWGQTHPNPLVGALIVEAGEIVAEGWHHRSGEPHAEIMAFKDLGRVPEAGATMYVTLEPCSTCGRTGACTSAIIKAGIARVVIGAIDPNPSHAGHGVDVLRDAGIDVSVGVLGPECDDLNLIFNHWILNQRPLIAAKMALTLDGKFAAASGHSQWVTGEIARDDVMRWRRYFPAIAVGAETVLSDNPSLTSRFDEGTFCPKRFIFDRTLKTISTSPNSKVFTDEFREKTIVVTLDSVDSSLLEEAGSIGVNVWLLPVGADGYPDWSRFLEQCGAADIFGVYFETGPTLATDMIESGKADYLFVYQAAKFMSDSHSRGIGSARGTVSMSDSFEMTHVRHQSFGNDFLTRGARVK